MPLYVIPDGWPVTTPCRIVRVRGSLTPSALLSPVSDSVKAGKPLGEMFLRNKCSPDLDFNGAIKLAG